MHKPMQQLCVLKTSGDEHLKERRYSQAIVYYNDILRRFPQEASRISCEQQMQRAIREIQLASRKNLCLCYLKIESYKECIAESKKILDIQPNNLKVIYRIGKAYLELKNYQTAEHYLKRGFYLDSQQVDIMKALSEIEERKENIARQNKNTGWNWIGKIIKLAWSIISCPFRRKQIHKQ